MLGHVADAERRRGRHGNGLDGVSSKGWTKAPSSGHNWGDIAKCVGVDSSSSRKLSNNVTSTTNLHRSTLKGERIPPIRQRSIERMLGSLGELSSFAYLIT